MTGPGVRRQKSKRCLGGGPRDRSSILPINFNTKPQCLEIVSPGFWPPVASGSRSCHQVPNNHSSERDLRLNRNSSDRGLDFWAKLDHSSLALKAILVCAPLVRGPPTPEKNQRNRQVSSGSCGSPVKHGEAKLHSQKACHLV